MAELPPPSVISLKGADTTPSLQYNNMTTVEKWIAYVHKNDAVVADISSPESPSVVRPLAGVDDPLRSAVHQVKAVNLCGAPLLLMATQGGLSVWHLAQNKLIASYQAENAADIFLSRGLASIEQKSTAVILVGHSDGTISVLDFSNDTLSLTKTLSKHHDTITDIQAGETATGDVIASADSAGELLIWSDDFDVMGNVSLTGDTVTSLHIAGSYVIAGCGSGLIKLFSIKGASEAVEIAAHARWINALAWSPSTSHFASVSEDMLLCVWSLSGDGKVQLVKHTLLKDCLLTGVAFADRSIIVSAYDWDRVYSFNNVL